MQELKIKGFLVRFKNQRSKIKNQNDKSKYKNDAAYFGKPALDSRHEHPNWQHAEVSDDE
ncbi:MAG: hypothetical protein AABY87_11515 [bacterium]